MVRTVQILEPQTQIPREKPILKEKRIGRPQSLSVEDLLNAIRLYATTSETELAKRLNVSRHTSISESQKHMAIRKAMGEPIKETKKQFRF